MILGAKKHFLVNPDLRKSMHVNFAKISEGWVLMHDFLFCTVSSSVSFCMHGNNAFENARRLNRISCNPTNAAFLRNAEHIVIDYETK